MAAAGEAQQAQIGEKVQELSTTLSPRADKITAGRGIEQGVAGEGGFYDQFRATQKTLYDKLDKFIPPDKEVPAAATQATLTKLSKTDPRVQDVVRALSGTKLENITEAFSGALQGEGPTTARIGGQKFELPTSMAEKLGIKSETGTLPFSALKDLRSRVGYLLENKDQIADIPTSQLKQIYGSMSRDMEMAAKQADAESFAKGAPTGAADAYGRANKYTAAGMDRVAMLKSVINRADSEGIVDAAMSNSREGATKIRAITRSIPSEARDTLAAYVVQKMGRALPGQQGAEGETFSSNTFLTNWNKLSPEAKIQLFVNDDVRRGLDNVDKVSQNIREGSKVFANPSGTQPAIALSSGVGGAVLGVLTGHPGAAGALVGGMGLANLSARLYTNPRFVAWLSRNTATPTGQLAAQLNNLARSATTPEEKRDFAALQQEIQNRQQEQPKND
jgi:hypothetical protein